MRALRLVEAMIALSLIVVGQQDTPAVPHEDQSDKQEHSSKPMLSNDALSPEQTAVYRAVLSDFLKGSDGALNLANITEPLDQSDKACFRGMDAGVFKESASVVHRLEGSLVSNTKIVLVDPVIQRQVIKENDPQNVIRKAVDEDGKATEEQIGESVKRAFQSGLFTLSEIVFDKEHHRAVVAYSFSCGMLCGNGNTLILKKIGQQWKVAKRCGGWVS